MHHSTNIQNICIIDNNDSFTYNLVQIVAKIKNCTYSILNNNPNDLNELGHFQKILLSPGPGVPSSAGNIYEILRHFYKTKSILGICLGHQAIAEVFGGKLLNLPKPLHGIQEQICITDPDEYLFSGLPEFFQGGLYHSWAVDEVNLPSSLIITAKSASGIIMGISHKEYDVKGLQFHPESVMTPLGTQIIENWLRHNS